MTTNCGSFKPEERATSVAAGIRMRVTAAAAIMVAQARFATGIRELANAHTRTVANEPHVPGPGLRRPVPKKVATSVAQSGARGQDARVTAGGTPALRSGVESINAQRRVALPSSAAAGRAPRSPTPVQSFRFAFAGSRSHSESPVRTPPRFE